MFCLCAFFRLFVLAEALCLCVSVKIKSQINILNKHGLLQKINAEARMKYLKKICVIFLCLLIIAGIRVHQVKAKYTEISAKKFDAIFIAKALEYQFEVAPAGGFDSNQIKLFLSTHPKCCGITVFPLRIVNYISGEVEMEVHSYYRTSAWSGPDVVNYYWGFVVISSNGDLINRTGMDIRESEVPKEFLD